jgi:hypothetical protein
MSNAYLVMRNIVRSLLEVYKPDTPVFLGRWHRETCRHKMKVKIDQANMDHCGTCSIPRQAIKQLS